MLGSSVCWWCVDFDEAFFVQLDLGVFQAEVGAVRHAADGDQHAVVKLGEFLAVVFGFDFDLFADGGHFVDPRFEPDFLERFFGIGHDRPREVGIRAGQNAVQRLDHRDLAAERGNKQSRVPCRCNRRRRRAGFRECPRLRARRWRSSRADCRGQTPWASPRSEPTARIAWSYSTNCWPCSVSTRSLFEPSK